jgi:flagellar basal-body rod modification protein FlgD
MSSTVSIAADAASLLGAALPSGAGSAMGKQEFLQLLVTQLRNQDPLEPLNDRDFIAQMAQLSALEATTGLANQVRDLTAVEQQAGALQMVGHKVRYAGPNDAPAEGVVTGVRLDEAAPVLLIGSQEIPLSAVQTVL